MKLFLKGDRCYTDKCAIERRAYPPGQHGQGRKKESEYGHQLREKQKARRIYGILENQFKTYFEKAERQPGVTGENLLSLVERRLDNVVYRLGFASSRPEARQMVRHNHFTLNGHKANIPSMLVRVGDVIEVKEKYKNTERFQIVKDRLATKNIPEWLEIDRDQLVGKVVALPTKEHIDVPIDEQLIVELYSK